MDSGLVRIFQPKKLRKEGKKKTFDKCRVICTKRVVEQQQKNKNWANETSFATPIPSISLLNQERKVSKIKGETGLPCLSPRSSGKLGPSMVLVFTFAFCFVVVAIKEVRRLRL